MLHFAFDSEAGISVPFCKWMLDGKTDGLATITSEVHKENIDLSNMFAYFSSHVPHSSAILQGKLPDMINNIEEISAGADI